MSSGPAEVTVVDQEGARQAQQRFDGHERDLPAAGDRPPSQQRPKLLPRVVDRQVQVIGEISHVARLFRKWLP
jgi:hypothetical protein